MNKMNLTLDLSGLAPTTRDKLLDGMTKLLYLQSCNIDQDITFYNDGPVKEEMKGWSKAAIDMVRQINSMKP